MLLKLTLAWDLKPVLILFSILLLFLFSGPQICLLSDWFSVDSSIMLPVKDHNYTMCSINAVDSARGQKHNSKWMVPSVPSLVDVFVGFCIK